MDDDQEPQSLKSLFSTAEEKRLALESAPNATSADFQTSLAEAIDLHQACLKLVRHLSLFSPNESLEDIATTDLPYLLLHYYLAELLHRQPSPSNSPSPRASIIQEARAAYEAFLTLLDGYDLLGEPLSRFSGGAGNYAKLWEQYREDPNGFSTISTTDAVAKRNAKIVNYKAEKALKEKLAVLRRNPRYSEDGDDEIVREVHLANLAFCTHMTLQSLESLNREMEVLAQAPAPLIPQNTSIEEDERHRHEAMAKEGYSERLDPPLRRLQSMFGPGSPLLTKEGQPLQPFTIVGTRAELQKGVFKPGHNLPTMSIDEYLEEERRRGNIIEGGGEASYNRPEPDEDNIEKADQATYKARQWDEFKEENPRGAGNTLNRG